MRTVAYVRGYTCNVLNIWDTCKYSVCVSNNIFIVCKVLKDCCPWHYIDFSLFI